MSTRPLLMAGLLAVAACTGSAERPGVTRTCHDLGGAAYSPCRVFRGALTLPQADQLHLYAQYFQIAAVGFVAEGRSRVFLGPVFAHEGGGGQRPDIPFSVVVPCALSINLVLQVPRGGGDEPGALVAPMEFDRGDGSDDLTTLIPGQPAGACVDKTNVQDLDHVLLTLNVPGVLSSGQIVLGEQTGANPLARLDTDLDGIPDLADDDDDDDGRPDLTDADADGDGILDNEQTLLALPDADGDGVPDLFQ